MIAAPAPTLQETLADKLLVAIDAAAESRRAYYVANPGHRPRLGDVDAIIARYANANALVAGALNLVPGPWGVLAMVPELVLVVQNQVRMIYDLGVAYGREAVLTRELILGILVSAMGSSGISLLTLHGGKVLVRRSSLQVLQRVIAALAGQITQRAIRAAIGKWLPVVGAAGNALWAHRSTVAIGRKAKEILSLEIEQEE